MGLTNRAAYTFVILSGFALLFPGTAFLNALAHDQNITPNPHRRGQYWQMDFHKVCTPVIVQAKISDIHVQWRDYWERFHDGNIFTGNYGEVQLLYSFKEYGHSKFSTQSSVYIEKWRFDHALPDGLEWNPGRYKEHLSYAPEGSHKSGKEIPKHKIYSHITCNEDLNRLAININAAEIDTKPVSAVDFYAWYGENKIEDKILEINDKASKRLAAEVLTLDKLGKKTLAKGIIQKSGSYVAKKIGALGLGPLGWLYTVYDTATDVTFLIHLLNDKTNKNQFMGMDICDIPLNDLKKKQSYRFYCDTYNKALLPDFVSSKNKQFGFVTVGYDVVVDFLPCKENKIRELLYDGYDPKIKLEQFGYKPPFGPHSSKQSFLPTPLSYNSPNHNLGFSNDYNILRESNLPSIHKIQFEEPKDEQKSHLNWIKEYISKQESLLRSILLHHGPSPGIVAEGGDIGEIIPPIFPIDDPNSRILEVADLGVAYYKDDSDNVFRAEAFWHFLDGNGNIPQEQNVYISIDENQPFNAGLMKDGQFVYEFEKDKNFQNSVDSIISIIGFENLDFIDDENSFSYELIAGKCVPIKVVVEEAEPEEYVCDTLRIVDKGVIVHQFHRKYQLYWKFECSNGDPIPKALSAFKRQLWASISETKGDNPPYSRGVAGDENSVSKVIQAEWMQPPGTKFTYSIDKMDFKFNPAETEIVISTNCKYPVLRTDPGYNDQPCILEGPPISGYENLENFNHDISIIPNEDKSVTVNAKIDYNGKPLPGVTVVFKLAESNPDIGTQKKWFSTKSSGEIGNQRIEFCGIWKNLESFSIKPTAIVFGQKIDLDYTPTSVDCNSENP